MGSFRMQVFWWPKNQVHKKSVSGLTFAFYLPFLLVREILCDRGESQWDLLEVWPSALSEENRSLLSRKGSVGCKRNLSCFPLSNLFERINENVPQRQRSTNTDEVFNKEHNLENTMNEPDTSVNKVQIRTSAVARGNKDVRSSSWGRPERKSFLLLASRDALQSSRIEFKNFRLFKYTLVNQHCYILDSRTRWFNWHIKE